MPSGAVPVQWDEFSRGWQPVEAEVIEEALVTLYVNGQELVTIMATPRQLEAYGLGFLKNEGLIEGVEDVDHIHVSHAACCVDIWLTRALTKPERRIVTTGCGGGVTFQDLSGAVDPLPDELRLDPEKLIGLFPQMHFPDSLHSRARGVHAAALSDGEQILALVEDVGRHNTIDKLLGECMQRRIETRGRILLATGRISSEMLHKSARMGCPIVASRNSPTSMSVAMADAWNITLVGYVRQRTMRVYSHSFRLTPSSAEPALGTGRAARQESTEA
jgi:FdhD protein